MRIRGTGCKVENVGIRAKGFGFGTDQRLEESHRGAELCDLLAQPRTPPHLSPSLALCLSHSLPPALSLLHRYSLSLTRWGGVERTKDSRRVIAVRNCVTSLLSRDRSAATSSLSLLTRS